MLYILLLLQSQRKIGISSSKSAVFIILYIVCKYSEIDPVQHKLLCYTHLGSTFTTNLVMVLR